MKYKMKFATKFLQKLSCKLSTNCYNKDQTKKIMTSSQALTQPKHWPNPNMQIYIKQ